MDAERRERIVCRWFDMWVKGTDTGIAEIFSPDVHYIESWGPEYRGAGEVKRWFDEWNTRGRVVAWNIGRYMHGEDRTVVEWFFESRMNDGGGDMFDGVSLVGWTPEGKIGFLKEFGCNVDRYDPYGDGDEKPRFRSGKILWF
ncbi:nuclear transport factor 2 family protein [Gallalistipes aquisgranensis]|uniref:nuclear transport factor 2 family protein n=1 Tax=Gallalistipes aquisgranensis TaxID=2779358 RepID=UPI001CF91D38|nr:nuclear transport factor 2 family protein [Gallalistipes aquisgranensis]MBE5033172.1 nuclear transport factor 2 family protein [Gallalistipes aquisgranensis]